MQDTDAPIAFSPEGLAKASANGRTKIFEAIRQGKLKARKSGRRTIILYDDAIAWLKSLPVREAGGAEEAERVEA